MQMHVCCFHIYGVGKYLLPEIQAASVYKLMNEKA